MRGPRTMTHFTPRAKVPRGSRPGVLHGRASTKRSSMAFLVQMGLPLSSDDVVVDVVVDGDGDGDELHRQSLVSIATVRASNSIP